METIWLQRSTADVPWGFRLQGGRDYGVPLSVQRVSSVYRCCTDAEQKEGRVERAGRVT